MSNLEDTHDFSEEPVNTTFPSPEPVEENLSAPEGMADVASAPSPLLPEESSLPMQDVSGISLNENPDDFMTPVASEAPVESVDAMNPPDPLFTEESVSPADFALPADSQVEPVPSDISPDPLNPSAFEDVSASNPPLADDAQAYSSDAYAPPAEGETPAFADENAAFAPAEELVMPAEEMPPLPSGDVPPLPSGEVPAGMFAEDGSQYQQYAPEMPLESDMPSDPFMGGQGDYQAPPAEIPLKDKIENKLQELKAKAIANKKKLIKWGSIIGGAVIVLFVGFKLAISPILEYSFERVLASLNLPVTDFSVIYADTTSLVAINLRKGGTVIATEVSLSYDFSDFVFSKKINNLTVAGINLRYDVKKDEIPAVVGGAFKSLFVRPSAIPDYTINGIVLRGQVLLSGDDTGKITFSGRGSLNQRLSLSVPLKIESELVKADINLKISGWGNNYDINLNTKNAEYINDFADTITSSVTSDIGMQAGVIRKLKLDSDFAFSDYAIKLASDLSYTSDFKGFVQFTSTKSAKPAASDDAVQESRARNRAKLPSVKRGTNVSSEEGEQTVNAEAQKAAYDIPLGEVKISFENGKLSGGLSNIKGSLPMQITADKIVFADTYANKVNLFLDGNILCDKGVCSYALNKDATLSVGDMSLSAFYYNFRTDKPLSLVLATQKASLFEFSEQSKMLAVSLQKPEIKGFLTETTSSLPFVSTANNALVKFTFNQDGKYEGKVSLNDFSFNNEALVFDKAQLEVALSSDKQPSLKLLASSALRKDMPIFTASSLHLEANPDAKNADVYRFKLAMKNQEFNASFYMYGLYDLIKGRGTTKFTLPPIALSEQVSLNKIFPFISPEISSSTGSISAKGNLNWSANGVTGPAQITFSDFSLRKGNIRLNSINGSIVVSSFSPTISTLKNQNLQIGRINLLMPFNTAGMKFTIENNDILIEDFSAGFLGGRVSNIDRIRIPFSLNTAPFLLIAKDVDLATLASRFDENIAMTGKVNVRLPLALRNNDTQIILADIQSVSSGSVKYTPKDPADNSAAARVLKDFAFSSLSGSLDGSANNGLRLRLKLEGTSPYLNNNQPTSQSLTLEGKLNTLLKGKTGNKK